MHVAGDLASFCLRVVLPHHDRHSVLKVFALDSKYDNACVAIYICLMI